MDGDPRDGAVPVDSGSNGLAAGTVAGASPRPDRSEPGSVSPAGFAGLSTDPFVGGSKQHLGLAVVAQQETKDDEPGDVDGSGNGTQHHNAELAAAAAAMPMDGKPPPVLAGSRHPQPPSADGERSTSDGTPAATGGSPAGVAGLQTSRGAPPLTAPPLPATPASSSKSGGAMKLGGGASMGPNISSAPRGMGGRHRHLEGGHGDAAGDSPPAAEASVAATAGTPASSSATQGPADDFGDILAGGHGPTPTAVASMEAVKEDGPDAGVSMASVARQTSPSPSSMEVDSLLAFPREYGTPSPPPPAAPVPPPAGRPSETAMEAEEEMLLPRQPPTAGGALSASRDEPGAWTGEERGGGAACPRDRALLPQLPTAAPHACSESDRAPQESGGSKESLTPPQGVRSSAEPIAARYSSPLPPPGPGGATGKVLNDFASPVTPVAAEQGGAAIGDRPTGRASVATPQGWLERDAAKRRPVDATPRVGVGAAGSDRTRSEAIDAVKSAGPPSLADSPVRRAGKGQEDEAVESRNNTVAQGVAAAGSEPLVPPPQLAPSSAEARSLSPGEVTTPRATLDPVEGGVDARLGVEQAPSRGGGGVQAMDVDGPQQQQQQQQQQQPSSTGMSGQQDRGFRSLDGEVYNGAFGSRASEGSAGGGDGGAGDEATDGAAGGVAGDMPGGSRPGQGRDPPARSSEEKEGAGEGPVGDVPRGVAGRRGRDAQPLSGLAPGVVLPALEGRASSEAAPAQTSSSSPAIPTPFEGNSVGMLAAGAANPCDFSGQSLADQLLADDPPEMMVVDEGFPAGERTALVGGGAPRASGGEAAVNAGGVSALGRRTNGDEALAGPRRSSTAAEPADTAALDRQRVGLKVGGGGEQPGWAARAAGASSSGGGGGAAAVGGFVPRGKTITATASESVLDHGPRTAAAPFDSSSSSRTADDATTTTAQSFLPPENDTYAALLGLRTPSSTSALAPPPPPQPTTPASAPSPAFSTSSTAVADMFGSRMSAQAVSGVVGGGGGGGGGSAAGSTAALRGMLPIGRPELRHPSLQQQQIQQLLQQQELRRRQQAAAAAEVGEFSSSFVAPAAAAAASVSGRRMSDVGARGFGGPSQTAVPRGAVSGRRPAQAAEETWRATGLTLPPATSTVTTAGGGDGSAQDRERRLSGVSGETSGVHAMGSAPLSSFGASPFAPQEAGARGEGRRNGRGLALQAVAQDPTASSSGAGLSPRFGGGAIGVNQFSDAPVANISYNSAQQSFGGSGSTSPRGRAGLHAAGAGAGAATSSSSAVTPFPSASAPASSSSLANGGPMHRAVAAAGNSFATHTSRTLPPPLSMTPGVSAGSSPRQAPAGWRSGPPGGTSNDTRVQQNSWLSNDGANGGGGGGISPRGFGQQPVARGSHHQLQVGSA
ncbi:unnamed protein product, partial [Ectocarpus sp. 8 AP-2014]